MGGNVSIQELSRLSFPRMEWGYSEALSWQDVWMKCIPLNEGLRIG